MTGVDFSHFNLAMRCLASGGGGGGGCWGCIERPSYIHLSPPTHSPPSLSRRSSRPPAPSSFPLFPPTFVAFHPFRPFSNLLCLFYLLLLHLLLRLHHPPPSPSPHLPPAQPLAHPSRLTYLNPLPPFLGLLSPSSFSQPRHPSALFLVTSVSHRLTFAPSFSRPLPRNAPADKQTADTSQFYAIVSFFICLFVSTLIQILLHTRSGEDPLTRKYPFIRYIIDKGRKKGRNVREEIVHANTL